MTKDIWTWAKFLLDLQDFVDEVNDSLDWLLWSQEATGNVEIRQAPPPSPMSPSAYQDALDRTRDQVSALPIPTFEAHLPSTNVVPTTGFDATRSEIRSRINDLLSCVSETTGANNAIDYFSLLDEALNRQVEMLRRLAKTMWELAEKFPVKVLVDVLAFQALDVEESYIPFVVATQDHVKAKRKAATDALRARLTVVRTAANEIRNILIVEAIDLDSARERLEQLDAEVLQLQEVVTKAAADRERISKEVNRLKTLCDAAEMDVAEAEARLDTAQETVAKLGDSITDVKAAISVPYKCPEFGVPWNECTNPDHYKYKKAYSENMSNLRNQLNQLQKDLDSARQKVSSIEQDLAGTRNTLATLKTQLSNAMDFLKTAEDRLQQARSDLTAKAEFVTREKYRLRADIFAAENISDQNQVKALIEQLGDAA